MLPNPLHPAVVHFPIVLALLLPIFAIGALWTIRRGARPRRAWGIPLDPRLLSMPGKMQPARIPVARPRPDFTA